jgi:hypothetical protein
MTLANSTIAPAGSCAEFEPAGRCRDTAVRASACRIALCGRASPRQGAAAGVKHRRIYDLRHTYATWSLAAGVDIFTLARRMGSSVKMSTGPMATWWPALMRTSGSCSTRSTRGQLEHLDAQQDEDAA